MLEKNTSDLQQELLSKPNLDRILSENAASFQQESATALLNRLYERTGLSKITLAKRSGMSEIYLHQIFGGQRTPSRDRLLSLCCAMDATLEETQEVLKRSSLARLYPKNRRDAIILHDIAHGTPLMEINNILFQEGEKPLF